MSAGKHAAVNPATLGHDHVAEQFRDGREPHCRTCGLTADGRTPNRHALRGGPGTGRGPAGDGQSRPPKGAAGGVHR
jgi:hypothetical protein